MSLMNLFNGGGSVRSRRSSSPGPKTREKLQPRSIGAILNSIQNRQNTEQRRWEGAGGEGPYPVFNQPNPDDRRHSLDTMSPGWLEASAPIDNTGIMTAAADYSPNFQGRWLTQSPTGNKLLSYLVDNFGSEGSSEYLEDILGTGGISAFGGTFSPSFERGDDGWNIGLTGKWSLGG